MRFRLVIIALTAILMMTGCIRVWRFHRGTPPPGWRSPVAALLLNESELPEGWQIDLEFPQGRITDPTINHVAREWWNPRKGSANITQSIWRAYTIEDAKEKYNQLRRQPFLLGTYTPQPWEEIYIEFRPPEEIDFRSQIADEFYLACGWLYGAECHVIARYRNYVTYMTLSLEAEYQGHKSDGLTYEEIEGVIRAMDAKFADFLKAYPVVTPTP